MHWMAAVGEIFHRDCPGKGIPWTSADDPSGKCFGCGEPIPKDVVKMAREKRAAQPPPSSGSK